MALTTVPVELASLDGAVTVNESSADADFRVESNGYTHMLFVDGGANCVNIGGSTDQGGLLNLEGYDADMLVLHRTADTGDQSILFKDHGDHNATISGKNGGALELRTNGNSTVAMNLDSAGHVTMPNQPAFRVKPSTNQSNFAIDGWVDVAFGNEAFDVGDNFASSTFTAPVTGKYQLNLQLRLNNVDSAANFYQAKIDTSNQIFYTTIDPDFGQDAAYWTFILSIFTDMDASDTATIGIFQSLGTSQTDVSNDSHFSGYLVA